jgi:hypothetical protein
LRSNLVRRALAQEATLADVRAFGVLADDDEVMRRLVTGRSADERPLIHVQVELEAHLQQQAAFDDTGRHFGRTDGAEQDRVEAPQLVEHRVRQDRPVAQVARAAEVERRRRHVDAGRFDNL